MKNIYIIAIVMGLAFTSCTKKSDYTCTCTVPPSTAASTSTLTNISEDDAKAACDNGAPGTPGAVCTLSEN
jgi:hypothetical protein